VLGLTGVLSHASVRPGLRPAMGVPPVNGPTGRSRQHIEEQ